LGEAVETGAVMMALPYYRGEHLAIIVAASFAMQLLKEGVVQSFTLPLLD
jgi:hypothetical protein